MVWTCPNSISLHWMITWHTVDYILWIPAAIRFLIWIDYIWLHMYWQIKQQTFFFSYKVKNAFIPDWVEIRVVTGGAYRRLRPDVAVQPPSGKPSNAAEPDSRAKVKVFTSQKGELHCSIWLKVWHVLVFQFHILYI